MIVHGHIIIVKRSGVDYTRFPLLKNACILGRGLECDIRVQIASVSNIHCQINIDAAGKAYMTNLSSVNPTLLNDYMLGFEEAIVLSHQDMIYITDRAFRWEYPENSPYAAENILHSPTKKGVFKLFCKERKCYDQIDVHRKRVSFGPYLSPEHFDKKLPPATPIKKGDKPTDLEKSTTETPKQLMSTSMKAESTGFLRSLIPTPIKTVIARPLGIKDGCEINSTKKAGLPTDTKKEMGTPKNIGKSETKRKRSESPASVCKRQKLQEKKTPKSEKKSWAETAKKGIVAKGIIQKLPIKVHMKRKLKKKVQCQEHKFKKEIPPMFNFGINSTGHINSPTPIIIRNKRVNTTVIPKVIFGKKNSPIQKKSPKLDGIKELFASPNCIKKKSPKSSVSPKISKLSPNKQRSSNISVKLSPNTPKSLKSSKLSPKTPSSSKISVKLSPKINSPKSVILSLQMSKSTKLSPNTPKSLKSSKLSLENTNHPKSIRLSLNNTKSLKSSKLSPKNPRSSRGSVKLSPINTSSPKLMRLSPNTPKLSLKISKLANTCPKSPKLSKISPKSLTSSKSSKAQTFITLPDHSKTMSQIVKSLTETQIMAKVQSSDEIKSKLGLSRYRKKYDTQRHEHKKHKAKSLESIKVSDPIENGRKSLGNMAISEILNNAKEKMYVNKSTHNSSNDSIYSTNSNSSNILRNTSFTTPSPKSPSSGRKSRASFPLNSSESLSKSNKFALENNATFDFSNIKTPEITADKFISPLDSINLNKSVPERIQNMQNESMNFFSTPSNKLSSPFADGINIRLAYSNNIRKYSNLNKSKVHHSLSSYLDTTSHGVSSTPKYDDLRMNDPESNGIRKSSIDRSITNMVAVNDLWVSPNTLKENLPEKNLSKSCNIGMNVQQSPSSDYSNINGLKQLKKTPRHAKSLDSDYSNVDVRRLMITPNQATSPIGDYTNVQGHKTLFTTPKVVTSPIADYNNVKGIKKLIRSPKSVKIVSPLANYTNVKELKRLMKSTTEVGPLADYTNVKGLKRLMKTPKSTKEVSPLADYTNIKGLQKLLRTPKAANSPVNDYTNVSGVNKLMDVPKRKVSTTLDIDLSNLFNTPEICSSNVNSVPANEALGFATPCNVLSVKRSARLQNKLLVTPVSYEKESTTDKKKAIDSVNPSSNLKCVPANENVTLNTQAPLLSVKRSARLRNKLLVTPVKYEKKSTRTNNTIGSVTTTKDSKMNTEVKDSVEVSIKRHARGRKLTTQEVPLEEPIKKSTRGRKITSQEVPVEEPIKKSKRGGKKTTDDVAEVQIKEQTRGRRKKIPAVLCETKVPTPENEIAEMSPKRGQRKGIKKIIEVSLPAVTRRGKRKLENESADDVEAKKKRATRGKKTEEDESISTKKGNLVTETLMKSPVKTGGKGRTKKQISSPISKESPKVTQRITRSRKI